MTGRLFKMFTKKSRAVSSYQTYHTLLLLALMANTGVINVSMYSIEDLTTVDILDTIRINSMNTIRKSKKWPDETSIYEFLNKNLEKANLTKITK